MTVASPQVDPKATLMVVESVHEPLQDPEVGQLQEEVQATDAGVIVQLTEVKLLTTVIPPPVIVRIFLDAPVTEIGEEVDVVTSKIFSPLGVVNVRVMPEFEKLKFVELTRVTV